MALGFAVGLVAASFFMAPGHDVEFKGSTPMPGPTSSLHSVPAANATAVNAQPAAPPPPATRFDRPLAQAQQGERAGRHSDEPITAPVEVEVSRTELPSAEPTPESLVDLNPMDAAVAVVPLTEQDTEALERDLRQATEFAAEPVPLANDSGLLAHERP